MQIRLLLTLLFSAAQDHPSKASPFESMRWQGTQPEVLVNNERHRPLAIDDLEVGQILESCNRRWPGRLQKRFAEDLMEAMAALELRPSWRQRSNY